MCGKTVVVYVDLIEIDKIQKTNNCVFSEYIPK
jgi:hypothetical protein